VEVYAPLQLAIFALLQLASLVTESTEGVRGFREREGGRASGVKR
jgi:hypothetical protein